MKTFLSALILVLTLIAFGLCLYMHWYMMAFTALCVGAIAIKLGLYEGPGPEGPRPSAY